MHLTRRILESKRLLAIFGSLNTQKPLPFIHQVSPTHPFHYSTIYADVYSKSQINNAITLHFSRTMQERWCFERPFSSKPSEDNGIKISNTAEDEDCELICQVINQTKWSEKTETELSSLNIKLSASIVLSVLETLEKNPETALNFFKWASTQDFSHTASTYNTVIGILGQKSCIDQFWNIVAEMTNYGHQMDMKTYQKVLRRFLNNKLMEDAVGLFVLKIGSTENKPSRQDFKMILHNLSLSSSPDIDLVYRVVETFENGNDKFDKTIYDDIHRCLTIAGRFDEAIGVMKTMEEEGFVPDNDTYSQLVFGLCKAGTLDEACRVLDAMKELGCTPNLKTWSILIDGHCRAGEIDGAVSCFELMLESGCNANQEILGTLVDSLCSQNRIEDAHSFLCKMIEKKDLKPSRSTLKKLLLKLISAEKLPEATKLSDLMMNQGFPAIVDPFYKIFAKSGTVDGAVDFLNKATKNRPRYLAVKVYFSMLNAFCEAGKQAYASKLLYKCPRHIQRNPDLLFQFGSVDTQHLKDTNPKKKIKSAKVL